MTSICISLVGLTVLEQHFVDAVLILSLGTVVVRHQKKNAGKFSAFLRLNFSADAGLKKLLLTYFWVILQYIIELLVIRRGPR